MAGSTFRRGLVDESGQVMVLTVLCMSILLGFIAFAVDVGMLLRAQRTMQTAADSAAIAAAAELGSDPVGAAIEDAKLNGITDGTNGTVTVNNAPASGSFKNNLAYVEVIVSQYQPTFFMRVFGQNSMLVSARAVATPQPTPNCVRTLGGAPGITVDNGGHLDVPGCNIFDNGTIQLPDGTITAKAIGVLTNPGDLLGLSVPPVTILNPIPDPLNYLAGPAIPPSCPATTLNGPSASTTLGPAAPGGTVCYSSLIIENGANVTLNPGTYIINGGALSFLTGPTVTGSGVTIYLANGASFNGTSDSTVQLSAPTSGTYQGILFFQPATDTQTMTIYSSNLWSLEGIIYLPGALLSLNGNNSSFDVDLVTNSLSVNDADFKIQPYAALSLASPITAPTLAE